MLEQEKNNNGFALLELLIVMVLVGIVSAIAYPNFSEWNKERKVRQDVDRIYSLMKNIHMQMERGSFAYVQVFFDPLPDEIHVQSRGITMQELASKINDGSDPWNDTTALADRCTLDTDDLWTVFPGSSSSEELNALVYDIFLENLDTNITESSGICFSRNGKFYRGAGSLGSGATGEPINYIYFCVKERTENCNIDGVDTGDDFPDPDPMMFSDGDDDKQLYVNVIKWSRYGNLTKYKFLVREGAESGSWK